MAELRLPVARRPLAGLLAGVFLLATALLFPSTAPAQDLAAAPPAPVVQAPVAIGATPQVLSTRTTSFAATPHLRIIDDPDARLGFTEVAQMFRRGQGQRLDSIDTFNGPRSRGYWLVMQISNQNPGKSMWTLNFGRRVDGTVGMADKILLYTDQYMAAPLMMDGRKVSHKRHLIGQDKNAIPLTIQPGHNQLVAIYLQPKAGSPLHFSLTTEERTAFNASSSRYATIQTAVLAVTGFLLFIFGIFQFFYPRTVPVLLSVYAVSHVAIFMSTDELVSIGNNTFAILSDTFVFAALASALLLTRAVAFSPSMHIDMPDSLRHKASRAISAALWLGAALWALSFLDTATGGIAATALNRFAPVVGPLALAAAAFTAARRSSRILESVFALSWLILGLGALTAQLSLLGLLPQKPALVNAYWIALLPHAALLALSSLRSLIALSEEQREIEAEQKLKREEEVEMRKSKEQAEQSRLLGIMQREKELMADLRNREAERIEALRRAKETADAANKAKSDFLAVISHEIRTPMTGIMGMIRLILDSPLNAAQKEYAETIQYAGEGMITLLNDILDFSKAEEGKMTLESFNFDLAKLLESIILLMSGRAGEKKISLTLDVTPDTPTMVKGDPTRVRQILLNLVTNAIKFTDKGGVTLSVKLHEESAGKYRVYFGVRDTGMGISEEGQKKLFAPYAQADASISRNFGGTGLGLAICKRLTEAMGGSIQLESKQGEGSLFYFIIPFEKPASEEAVAAAAAAVANVPPLSILVVDDNTINLRVMQGLLEKDKHKIVVAGGADAALKELAAISFDVVLMDMEMPVTDGLEATRMIRALADPAKAQTPVIAMTGNTRPEDIQRCRDAGMQDHVGKPINPEQLRKALHTLMRNRIPVLSQSASAPVAEVVPAVAAVEAPPAFVPLQSPDQPTLSLPEGPSSLSLENSDTDEALDFGVDIAPAPVVVDAPVEPVQESAPQASAADMAETTPVASGDLFDPSMLDSLKDSMKRDDLLDMIDGLYQQTEEIIINAEKAVQAQDYAVLGARGHELKGMAANFGLMTLSAMAGKIEKVARGPAPEAELEQLQRWVRDLRPTFYDTRSALDKWAKG